VNQAAFEWLSRRQRERPFFLYLHSVDPHQPYTPPSPYRERFAPDVDVDRLGFIKDHLAGISAGDRSDVMRLYDAEIALSDANFGAFVDHLQTLGLYDASLIILIADHGEEFHEHGGWLHGKTLYDEALRVPLVIKFPHGFGAGVRSDQLAQQIDILPTVLAVVGQDVPPQLHGRNLIPLVTATGGPQPPAFSARVREGSAMESVSAGGMKLIHNRYGRTPTLELYDLTQDPGEQHNLVAERQIARGYLQALLRATQPSETDSLPRAAAKLDAATKERLRALGYAP
jgi:arylsulfatase A-like enzyme